MEDAAAAATVLETTPKVEHKKLAHSKSASQYKMDQVTNYDLGFWNKLKQHSMEFALITAGTNL